MTFNDGEDYPTVIKDAVIKIYSGETLVETLITDTSGEAETHLAAARTYRVTTAAPSGVRKDRPMKQTKHICFAH